MENLVNVNEGIIVSSGIFSSRFLGAANSKRLRLNPRQRLH